MNLLKKRLILLCMSLIVCSNIGETNAASIVGKESPNFTLVDTEGEEISLSQMQGKPLLLLFADESELSQEKLSALVEIFDYYLASELKILSIVTGKDPEEAWEFQEELWLTYTLYSDLEEKIAKIYNIKQFPQVVILDNNHMVRYVGDYTTDKELHRELFQWMEEKVFNIIAEKFFYTPNIITVNKGDKVLIKLTAEDVTHGIFIDGYELYVNKYLDREGNIVADEKADHYIMPGGLGIVRFVANKSGRFTMRCAATCAAYHPYMMGYLKVKPNYRFFVAILLSLFLGGLSLVYFLKEKNRDRILGIFSTNWRFELTRYPIVLSVLKSRWIPFLGIVFNILFFTIILVACFVGGVSAGNYNFGIMFVWILWYSLLMMIMVPLFSRIWCGVCPLPFFGDLLQRGSLMGVRKKLAGLNKKWPKALRNMWLVNFLFIGTTFANGYLTTRPISSFIMFAIIILLATIIAWIYQKRTFCLYICPVGGFQGLYSNLATIEIRMKDAEICKKHTLKTCVTGNEKGYGCPWLELPFKMNRNTYCGMCLECFKTCPHDNMALNIRAPAVDLLVDERRGLDESWKGFIMLGCAIVFYVFMMGPWGFLKDWQNAKTLSGFIYYIVSHSLFTLILLPLIFGFFVYLSRVMSKAKEISYKKMFINFSYCLLPFGLLTWVAFSLGFLLPNGSYLIAVISDPFAWGWDLFGTAKFPWTPFLTGIMPYLQLLSFLFGLIFSIDIGVKISQQMFSDKKQAIKSVLPIVAYLILMTVALIWLFLG